MSVLAFEKIKSKNVPFWLGIEFIWHKSQHNIPSIRSLAISVVRPTTKLQLWMCTTTNNCVHVFHKHVIRRLPHIRSKTNGRYVIRIFATPTCTHSCSKRKPCFVEILVFLIFCSLFLYFPKKLVWYILVVAFWLPIDYFGISTQTFYKRIRTKFFISIIFFFLLIR
jgi:hypothetical protein